MDVQKIVILGGGFGGIIAALECVKQQKAYSEIRTEITLVDRNDFHLFTPDLYEIASAMEPIQNTDELTGVICIKIKDILAGSPVQFVQASIERIDPRAKRVHTSAGELSYDYAVIALGSESFYFGIDGMQQHSLPLKTVEDALTIRKTIDSLIKQKKDAQILVCGGGPAGVEFAAELHHACMRMHPDACPSTTIIEGREQLLGMFQPRAQQIATRRLQQLGIHVKTGYTIAHAEQGKVVSTEQEELSGDVIIWTGGVQANHILKTLNGSLNARGQLPVHRTLESKEFSDLFVVGDAMECQMPDGSYATQTAYEAVAEGRFVAQNLFRAIQEQPLKEYRTVFKGFVITLGGKYGLFIFSNGWSLGGVIGWVIHRWVNFMHLRSVLPYMRAWRFWVRGVRVMDKND